MHDYIDQNVLYVWMYKAVIVMCQYIVPLLIRRMVREWYGGVCRGIPIRKAVGAEG